MKRSFGWWNLLWKDNRSIRWCIAIVFCTGFMVFQFLMDQRGASVGDWLYISYLQWSGREDWRWFLLHPVYTLGFMLTLYAFLGCVEKSIKTCGGMILLMKGSRTRFWLSSCNYVLISTLVLAICSALFSLLIFSIFGKLSLSTTSLSAEYVRLWIDEKWSGYIPGVMLLVRETVLIPFLFSLLLNLFQLLLDLWRKKVLSYLLSVGLFMVLPFLSIKYIDNEGLGIFDSTRSRWVIVCLITVSISIVIVGMFKIRKVDLLAREL